MYHLTAMLISTHICEGLFPHNIIKFCAKGILVMLFKVETCNRTAFFLKPFCNSLKLMQLVLNQLSFYILKVEFKITLSRTIIYFQF